MIGFAQFTREVGVIYAIWGHSKNKYLFLRGHFEALPKLFAPTVSRLSYIGWEPNL